MLHTHPVPHIYGVNVSKLFGHSLGDVGEVAPPSEDVVALVSADSCGLERGDGGGPREGAGPGGASIWEEI